MIKSTLTFGILKLISEQQSLKKTLPSTILLWPDWRKGQIDREIKNTITDIVDLAAYKHLIGALKIDGRLTSEACGKIYEELTQYSFYGSDFDFFGLIYEALANKEIKKDFGEFYTPRHIIRTIVKLLLKDETSPRRIKICDPACGTGGFLVESFLFLQRVFEKNKKLTSSSLRELKENTFFGLDTNNIVAIPFARTNMLMADDGGINIKETQDSLIELPDEEYDYMLTNIPYGKYDGNADISNFSYTNSKRFELLFLEKIVKALKPGGKAAVIVPDGLVESTSNAEYRKSLLHDCNIDGVVSLPPFVFEPYTSEKTYVLLLTKKRPSEKGVIQTDPVYFFIVDNDGFQDGKKRYPINDDDLPVLEECYREKSLNDKAGFIDSSEIIEKTYYSLSAEYYIRRKEPIEIGIDEFKTVLKTAKRILRK